MMYVLDTDMLIYMMKGNEVIEKKIQYMDHTTIFTTVINKAELLYGAYKSNRQTKSLQALNMLLSNIHYLDITHKTLDIFARDKAKLANSGEIIADMDLLIASICKTHQAILVTNNHKHFKRIKDLLLENWLEC